MRNLAIGVIIIALLALGAFILVQGQNKKTDSNSNTKQESQTSTDTNTDTTTDTNTDTGTSDQNNSTGQEVPTSVTVNYSDNGFSPSPATVKSGGTITWVNKSDKQIQIAVDPHPSHTGNREVSGGQFTLNLDAGESQTVTVNKTGTFGYHDHLNPGEVGTIIVK